MINTDDQEVISPEQIQLALGLHPHQMAAANALAQVGQGQQYPQDEDQSDSAPAGDKTEQPKDEKPLVSMPPVGGQPRAISTEPVTLPPRSKYVKDSSGLMVPAKVGPPEPPTDEAPPTVSAPGGTGPSLGMGTTARPTSQENVDQEHLQDRERKDRAELERKQDTGSGVSQFQHRHHILGPIVRGLSIAGTVLAPGAMAQVPGTDIHHELLMNQDRERINNDIKDQSSHQNMIDKESVDRARQETTQAKEETNRIRDAHFKAMDELKKSAEEAKEAMRNISYDPKTHQFMRGDQEYTPKDFQEGAILETQHGVDNGHYTHMWLQEKRNQAAQTHISNPSAEAERYNDWKAAFVRDNKRQPTADEIQEQHFNPNTGAGNKDHSTQLSALETKKKADYL